jgi:uncharacterized hydrophobic protein (TIGR00271 family)
MRQLRVLVPRGHGEDVLRIARDHQAVNLAAWEAAGDGPLDAVMIHVSNHRVGDLLDRLGDLPDLRVTLLPQGVIALHPPAAEVADQAADVEPRSPIEVYLGALQSIGSWTGFLGYAAASGVIVWIGLYTNTIFLLVAAMLVAPYAGPAMVSAVGTARGDGRLLLRGLGRYAGGLAVATAVAALLSLLLGQQIATEQMVSITEISSTAVLLPLVAGAAGALNLTQSERSSLVPGAAIGVLVAASLAPPAGAAGMAATLGRWDLVVNGVFLLLLQLAGINLAGALVFRAYGLTAEGPRYQRGRDGVFYAALAGSVAAIGGLLVWQFADTPEMQRATVARRVTAEVKAAVDESGLAEMVEANVRFTRARIPGQHTLLGVVYVQRRADTGAPAGDVRPRLTRAIQARVRAAGYGVTPLIDVTVLEPPAGDEPRAD